jgi:hypothetical protein
MATNMTATYVRLNHTQKKIIKEYCEEHNIMMSRFIATAAVEAVRHANEQLEKLKDLEK